MEIQTNHHMCGAGLRAGAACSPPGSAGHSQWGGEGWGPPTTATVGAGWPGQGLQRGDAGHAAREKAATELLTARNSYTRVPLVGLIELIVQTSWAKRYNLLQLQQGGSTGGVGMPGSPGGVGDVGVGPCRGRDGNRGVQGCRTASGTRIRGRRQTGEWEERRSMASSRSITAWSPLGSVPARAALGGRAGASKGCR